MGKWLWRRDRSDAGMDEKMRFHIEMEAERLVRERGLDPQEARRQAHVAFGGVEKYKEEGRDTRRLRWLDALSLDARLGARMLVKHRGLTIVGGFAMAVAIAVGAVSFEVISEVLDPGLPFKDGDRVVALQNATANPGSPERRVLHDFIEWRQQLSSIEQLGAFRTVQHNLVTSTVPPEPVKVAEITASGFVVAGTPPRLGRYLLPDDERESASPVVLIGFQEWQTRFAADPQIVGRSISLGGVAHTVVGVMPEGFRFPVDHQFWAPLRVNPLKYERLRGPALYVFGRLAPGATLETAQTELTAIGQRTAAAYSREYERLRPLVLPYTREHLELEQPRIVLMLRLAQLVIGALCFVVAVNLAILTYARIVTRLGEFALRTALGASRRRILAQLFIEAFALSIVGAAAGLMLSKIALERIQALMPANGAMPFWLDFDLSLPSVIYAFGLAALAALIMGVLPGLEATGSRLSASLHELNVRTGARLGPVWTSLVVAQVAVVVAVLPVAVFMAAQMLRMEVEGPGFAAGKFVVGAVALSDETTAADAARIRSGQLELMSRLHDEPGVSAVAFSSSMPGFAPSRWIEFEDKALRDAGSPEVSTLDVGVEMFETYGAQVLAGRAFNASDIGAANSVIVNRTFVQELIGNRGALGARFRYSRGEAFTPWYQIVGIVGDFPSFSPAPGSDGEPTVYHPAAPGDVHPFTLSVRFSGDVPADFVDRFRLLGADVDPALQLRRAGRLSQFYDEQRALWRHLAWALALLTASVLLLSAAGIYALMSFTVAQRTREIGIRAALGAAPHRLIFSIFGRVTRQLALGVLLGSLVSGAVFLSTDLGVGRASAILLTVAAMMTIVGLLAAFGPARRGLRVQASEALRAVGVILAVSMSAASASAQEPQRGTVIDRVECAGDPAQTYALYLPSTYSADRKWSVLLGFHPGARGRAMVEKFQAGAEQYGYIVAASNNSRNGPYAASIAAAQAMVADVSRRFSLDPQRVYLTGMSGGARVATGIALGNKGNIAGVIASSAGYPDAKPRSSVTFAVFGTAGTEDFNYLEMRLLDRKLTTPHFLAVFRGGHTLPPDETAVDALAWMELQAMQSGRRNRDEALAGRLLEKRRSAIAAATESAEIVYLLTALVSDFRGLADVSAEARRLEDMSRQPDVKKALKRQQDSENAEGRVLGEIIDLEARLGGDGHDVALLTLRDRLSKLARNAAAEADTPERSQARRVLRSVTAGASGRVQDRDYLKMLEEFRASASPNR